MFIPLIVAGVVLAQSPATRPEFEVASVRLNPNCAGNRGRGIGPTPGRLSLSCTSLRNIIRLAYGAFVNGAMTARPPEVQGGPGWLDTELYDINAKAADVVPVAQLMGPMLQSLLEERLKLKVHRESKEAPVYVLTVGKNGPRYSAAKFSQAKEGSCTPIDLNNMPQRPEPGQPAPRYCGGGGMRSRAGNIITEGYAVTMAEFAGRMLAGNVDRPVIDRTGLTGRYDISLEFVRDYLPAGPARLNGADVPVLPEPPPDAGPSIFTALQEQLGLKLTPDKGSIEILVVDHAEKPSEN